VFVTSLGRVAIVRGGPDPRDEVEVEVGAMRLRVPRSTLRQAPPPQPPPAAPITLPAGPTVGASISVRGQTVDDALLAVDRYLDEAVRARLPQVTIIHGKGTGALRRALHAFLHGHPHVREFRLGARGEGDGGATIVTLVV
jgi:DNA mismatch repair protein MutS2